MTTAMPVAPQFEDDRTGLSVETLKRAFMDNLFYIQGKFPQIASQHDYYMALAFTVRDRMLQRWISTAQTYTAHQSRTVCYLSAEFLMGPHLGNNLINLGIYDQVKQAITELGLDFTALLYQEEEPGLGNGGLGRLAACFLDSLATLQIPAIGYGIRYEFGIFDQEIRDGWQVEITDKWLRYGNPWELPRPEWAVEVKLGGHTEAYTDEQGQYRVRWHPYQVVKGIPYDTPILGYLVNTANTLRLWKAEAPESFDFTAFNRGDYYGAVDEKIISENVTKVLYPNDEPIQGKRLRLVQQIFFVSCSLQDMFRILRGQGLPVTRFHEKFTVQLNDTHPAVAVAELMRLLLDEYGVDWDTSWEITRRSCAYTNHTLLPEALERWPLSLFGTLLPRHLEIIYEINQRFLDLVRERFPGDAGKIQRMSLIDESGERYVRMANLATVGGMAVNGVAALHTDLLKQTVMRDFYELWPDKFQNKTNGVTPRRWVLLSNLRLSKLIATRIGKTWVTNYDELQRLEEHQHDPSFRQEWRDIKRAIKTDLVGYIEQRTGIVVSPDSLFDVLIKRIHEYKRQHLQALHIVSLYNRLKRDPNLNIPARTFIFGGKAAPGYFMAKLIIKLINAIGEVINHDPEIGGKIKVVFLPDYNVKFSQRVFPAADLSEQISTAGKEASGTGNMKFAMNGALTIGTLDGANVEIREKVGAENFFLFGLNAPEVMALKAHGYRPWEFYNQNPVLKEVIDQIAGGMFSQGDTSLFRPIVDSLLNHDPFLLMADFQSYIDCQERVSQAYQDTERWTCMSILNSARTGFFSSDRSMQQYCQDIWHVSPVAIEVKPYDHNRAGQHL